MRYLAIFSLMAALGAAAQTTYDYRVEYHEGPVRVTAGYGSVTVGDSDGCFSATLGGHSIDWAGRVYTVADTLVACFSEEPTAETVHYVNGVYTKPHVGTEPAPGQFRNILGEGQLSCSDETIEAVAVTAQMLGLYRLLPMLNGKMHYGEHLRVPIDTPDGREWLSLTYLGSDPCGLERYSFMYTYQGYEVPYEVTCLVDPADGVPQSFSADIRIGHVAMERY